jgi:hypothetical protein
MSAHAVASRRVLVVFVGETQIKWLRVLKKGYRHCFAVIQAHDGWAVYNPLSHYTEINIYPCVEEGVIAQFYEDLGYTVVRAQVHEPAKTLAPLAPFTCVEAVKRAVGLHARTVVTPWQLYKYLEKNHKIEKNSLTLTGKSG